jgi:hypothetical protein
MATARNRKAKWWLIGAVWLGPLVVLPLYFVPVRPANA